MQPREFLALADQLQAFQVIMSGSLKEETKAAKEALAALGSAQELKALEASFGKVKADHDAYVEKVSKQVDQAEADLEAAHKAVIQREIEVAQAEAGLAIKESQAKDTVRSAENKVRELEVLANKQEKRLQAAIKAAEQVRLELKAKEETVAAREADVEKKLAVIKSLG